MPGGSSSGSAVAVGTGEADVAFGSDTGGSIRIPAACCGVAGLKTTRGRVPLEGVLPLAPIPRHHRPHGRGRRAESCWRHGPARARLRARHRTGARPVVGRVRLPAEPEVDQALDDALRAAGLDVVEVGPSRLVDRRTAAAMRSWAPRPGRCIGDLWRRHARRAVARCERPPAGRRSISAAAVREARQRAGAGRRSWPTFRSGRQILALPTLAGPHPTLEDAARLTEIRYVAPFNLAGVPALALPVVGPGRGGFPPACSSPARPGSEELLLATAAAVEASGRLLRLS